MPQSLLAFLAMMIATTSALTQFASSNQVREEMLKSELEIMANAVALEAVELEAVPAGFDGLAEYQDRQDYSYFTVEASPSRLDQADNYGMRNEQFRKEWTVRYVDSNGDESAVATDIREITVSVYHARYDRPLVQHTRLVGQ